MRFIAHFVSFTVLLGLLGCGSRHQFIGVEDEKKRWAAEGWSYLETFGRPSEDTVMVANASSETAREMTAFARTDGVATNRVYAQTNNFYLILRMQQPTGDVFALVFTKPKP